MRTQVNPGSLLEVTGSFELHQTTRIVVDRESGQTLDLGGLLRSFLEDPEETITGPIRIRIESAMISPSADFTVRPAEYAFAKFNQNDPAGLWKEGDIVVDLGPEAPGSPVRTFWMLRTNETLSLSNAYENHALRKFDRVTAPAGSSS